MIPEEHAAALLEKHSIAAVPVQAAEIAVKEGAKVVRHHFKGVESGFTLRDDGGHPIIGLNTNTSPRRQNCSVAHSLGHLLIHDRPLIICCSVRMYRPEKPSSPVACDQEEAEANAFAAALLMPCDLLTATLGAWITESGADPAHFPRDSLIEQLCCEFNVSTEAMAFRLASIGAMWA